MKPPSTRTPCTTYDRPQVEKGYIRVSDKPGIDIEINEEGMRKYATPGVPFFA